MARRKKLLKIIFGVIVGVLISQIVTLYNRDLKTCELQPSRFMRKNVDPIELIGDDIAADSDFDKSLLLVGVMTAEKYLNTRAKAVYETWGRNVPGKILFFSSEYSYSDSIPLVPLPGVDDTYPPQKKSFSMLKYMHDNYIDKFEWFLRADDDVYIRTDRIESLLRSVDSRKPWFIGQTGRGNNEEFGLLSLENDENFCMGGPGVIMSRETLKRITPFIDDCLQNLYTTHEDVELGRCVRRFAGVSCTWSYEMQVILYHNQSGQNAFTGDLKQKEVHRAITLHPVKQPENMYRLHKYVKGLKIQDNQQETINLHRDIANSMSQLGVQIDELHSAELVEDFPLFTETPGSDGYLGDPAILGKPTSLNRFKADTLKDVLDWELISKSLFSYKDLNPRRRIGTTMKEGLGDVIREIMELINSFSKQRGRVIDFKEILYGYWRLDPIHGVDLILDLLLIYRKYRGHKMTVHVRRHAYVQQTFTGVEVREIDTSKKDSSDKTDWTQDDVPVHKKIVNQLISKIESNLPTVFDFEQKRKPEKFINFILPLSGRFTTFVRFLSIYENFCIKEKESTRLFIVLYRDTKEPEDFNRTLSLLLKVQKKYPNHHISLTTIEEPFSRGKALQYGVNNVKLDDLMFFIDVDIVFDSKSLLRVRQNTIRNKKVYFPIVYSLYNPKLINKTFPIDDYTLYIPSSVINEVNGFWRQFGFGIVSLYKSDYIKLGGFNMSIHGWGFEDVTFYDNVIKSDLKIVRSADPSLIHVYHPVDCDTNLESAQKNMCIGTQASTLASLEILQGYFRKFKYLFR